MRGEHAGRPRTPRWRRGSSPHARGARRSVSVGSFSARIIPACAGSTYTGFRRLRTPEDHPRMRGEHCGLPTGAARLRGSSPHARGALVRAHRAALGGRIIPACAGSTAEGARPQLLSQDHPRMRGEHAVGYRLESRSKGSSPHARGALENIRLIVGGVGIIPACAGSTRPPRGSCSPTEDHPRMRGEHRRVLVHRDRPEGSSPHARGAHFAFVAMEMDEGIIPACAGSTIRPALVVERLEDHPRMRGEHPLAGATAAVGTGSSPHARGARAATAARSPPRGDHPRMRGEHVELSRTREQSEGSSPHARGALALHASRGGEGRIIPACAGSTLRGVQVRHVGRDHPRMRGEHL